jgi:hypothetical protein
MKGKSTQLSFRKPQYVTVLFFYTGSLRRNIIHFRKKNKSDLTRVNYSKSATTVLLSKRSRNKFQFQHASSAVVETD